MFIITKITLTARLATDYEPMPLDAALALATDLNRDALKGGEHDRWILDPA